MQHRTFYRDSSFLVLKKYSIHLFLSLNLRIFAVQQNQSVYEKKGIACGL